MEPTIAVENVSWWQKVRFNLWISWITTTAVYLLFFFTIAQIGKLFKLITFVIGLFVPFGVLNLMGALGGLASGRSLSLLSIPLFFLVLFICNKILNKLAITGKKRILLNLIVLFVLTIIVDLLIWGSWASLGLFTANPIQY